MNNKTAIIEKYKHLLSLKYSKRTIESYSNYVDEFLGFSKNAPLRITNEDFINYNISLVRMKVADSTRNVAISGVKLYFKLILKKTIKENIAIRPKDKKRVVRHIEHFTLLDKIANTQNLKARLILTLGYGCGLRSDEVRNLKRTDVNLKEKFIIVNGKGSRQRKLPISNNVIDLILEYGFKYKPKEYLFNGQVIKGVLKPQYSAQSILALVKKNVGNHRFHDLRHSFGIRLYSQGVPLEQIRQLMGHKKTETTEIYAYASENMLLSVEMPFS